MNKKLLLIPISVAAFLILFLVPFFQTTLVSRCAMPCTSHPYYPNAIQTIVPDGNSLVYSDTLYVSLTFALFGVGGMTTGFGFFAIQLSNLTTFGVLVVVVSPLVIFAIVGLVAAVLQGAQENQRFLGKRPREPPDLEHIKSK